MTETLTDLLLRVSNMLLIPDIVLLLALLAMVLAYLGGLLAEAFARRQRQGAFKGFVAALEQDPSRVFRQDQVPASQGLPLRVFRQGAGGSRKELDDLQLEVERQLGRLGLGIRLGPILGLVGTLVPLGPALVALSTGDLKTLSGRLVVAFTTTVIGLVIGAASFVMYSVRRHWYVQDLNDIEFVAGRIEGRA